MDIMDTPIQNIVVGWTTEGLRDTKCPFCKCWRKKTDFISRERLVKSCMNCRKHAKINNTRNADKRREYYENNREKLLNYQKDYAINKTADYKSYQKKYYEKNKDKIIKQTTTYYKDNKKEYPLHTKARNMIYCAISRDKIKRRVEDINDYVDIPYIHELFAKQQGLCWYEDCEVKMDYTTFNHTEKSDNLITLQRLNDLLPHTKANCVLSCFKCNVLRRRQMT